MFDTFRASKVLEFPRLGLAAILELYCDFSAPAQRLAHPKTNKRYGQMRARRHSFPPLHLRQPPQRAPQLRAASPTLTTSRAGFPTVPDAFVREVLAPSSETALRFHAPEPYEAEGGTGFNGYDTLESRWNKATLGLDGAYSVQREVFRAVHV
ncbi:hypothetical protein V8E53_013532 [Lactarius tabidus]